MVPIVEQAATQLEPDVRLVKVDGDAVPELLRRPNGARPTSSLWVDMVISLRERLLGGVTYELMHDAPVPLLMAH
jgi:hypothetical protein